MLMLEFEDEPTREIPTETMSYLLDVVGYRAIGPDRPTRDMHPIRPVTDDMSDGVPVIASPAGDDTQPAWIPRASTAV